MDELTTHPSIPETSRFSSSSLLSFLQNRLAPAMVFAYQLVVLACFIAVPILANKWLRQPFIGAFVEHTLLVNTVTPTQPGTWELSRLGLPFGYQVTAVDGQKVQNVGELNRALAGHQPGERIRLTLQAPDGTTATQEISLQPFPLADQVTFLFIPYLVGLVYLGSSLWVFGLRRGDAAGRAFALFTASLAMLQAGLFDLYTTNALTYLWTGSLALAGGALFNLALLFPEEVPLVARYPFLRWAGYIPAALVAGIALPTLFNFARPLAYVSSWRLEFLFSGLSLIFFLVWTTVRRFKSASPIVREQARLILLGSIFSFGPMAIWFFLTSIWVSLKFSSFLLLPLVIFPVLIAYAILRYRLLNTDYLFSRVVLYGLLTLLATVGYALLVSGVSLISGNAIASNNPLLIGLMVFLLAILFNPLRIRLQKSVDAIFFRGQTVYQERLQTFGRELTQALEIPAIVERLRETVEQGLFPSQLHIFVHDPLSDQYVASPDRNGELSTDLRFPANSVMIQTLAHRRSSIFLGRADTLPTPLQTERARLALLGVQLFVPMPGRAALVGWLGLGPRRSGEPYTNHDLNYLESLSDQAALAIERAQVVADLERRVHEMDVLTRVAQGINITLAFDDILELIYAQTNHVIPTRDLRITLASHSGGHLYHAFYLENDERLNERENIPLPANQGLEGEVIHSRRALLSDDYERECRDRGVLPSIEGLYAWMGVPLNAGAEVIGAISLGSRDASVVYTEQQRDLLQAIADQAAGAIVKARLLEESERRARQLASLNEIGRSLTSTLDIKPLLNQIMQRAVEILNCEAGSLFLLDEQNGDLIFEVTVGPVASNLVGQRLPPGTGIVGEAVDSGKPVIANDVQRAKGWFDQPDRQTGFITRDLLVVPMQVKERVIGVIEVINKSDGSPFSLDDQELLTIFTSQAAVAIENARLYTQTDEALRDRLEEMSVMQRIDRELNAGLDMERAAHITLEWAIRQSKSDAGLVGVLEEAGLRVIASQGFSPEASYFPGLVKAAAREVEALYLPEEFPALQEVIQSGQPHTSHFATPPEGETAESGSFEGKLSSRARGQIILPIRRETRVIGVILMEKTQSDTWPEETVTFLSRLSDHAAMAISNGQLYADLQAANQAKSDFVSLVSHELKTPMTSIKGYAELLSQGTVGPITDIQANFLGTIRTNVNRMATLVSDLADVSRIEAGRLHLEFSAVTLSEIVEEVIRSAQAQIDGKEQSLELQIPSDLPPVWGDRNRLTQVLANLVSNANKYTPSNGTITLSAGRSANQWDPEGAPEVVHVAVKDTGFGISEKDQAKIFQKFFRSEDQNIRDAPGTGLGLNITRYLVEMQGGRIWFDSQPGKGTTFHFTVPVAATA